jgi:hypothetical protein
VEEGSATGVPYLPEWGARRVEESAETEQETCDSQEIEQRWHGCGAWGMGTRRGSQGRDALLIRTLYCF